MTRSSSRGGDRTDRGPDALGAALRLLNHRQRSTAELRSRLRQKGLPEDEVADAVARLRAWGYLDDRSFAQAWINDRTSLRPMGRIRLKTELGLKGVAPELIDEVLQVRDEDLEIRMATDLLHKRVGARRPQPTSDGVEGAQAAASVQRRLMSFLLRRGFSLATARRALSALNLETCPQDPEP